MSNVQCTKGKHIPFETYMALINRVFGFTTDEQKFEGLLPKLYQPKYRPQDSNYIVTEDDTLVAAVGAYDHEIMVCGTTIPCRGIGNVAVAPETRGKGYMKDCMNAALSDMVKDGIALSTLGGRRQRYQYFSYEKAGPSYSFYLNADNIRHTYGTSDAPYDTFRQVTREDTELIANIKALIDSRDFSPVRDLEAFVDICETWHARLYAVTNKGELMGYCIMEQGGFVAEIQAVDKENFMPLLRTIFAGYQNGGISIRLPLFEDAYIRQLAPVAEGGSLGYSMCYTVLNYALVTQAFFDLKATYAKLADGEMKLLIHGFAGDEYLHIEVKDGKPTVKNLAPETPCDCEWSHTEAMTYLYSPICPERADLPGVAQNWFPLPLWMFRADEV